MSDPGWKLDPKEIVREFGERAPDVFEAASQIPPETLERAAEFETEWTKKGVPDGSYMSPRMHFGFAAGQLTAAGVSRELLHEYLDAVLDFIEEIKQ